MRLQRRAEQRRADGKLRAPAGRLPCSWRPAATAPAWHGGTRTPAIVRMGENTRKMGLLREELLKVSIATSLTFQRQPCGTCRSVERRAQ